METLKISRNDFYAFIERKIADKKEKTIGVVKKANNYVFSELTSAAELCLDYDVTILPPKKFFQPPKEVLLKFVPKKADSYVAVNDCEPLAIIGVHYYDLAAIYLMDKAFSDGQRDEHYLEKRKNSLLIGMYPTKPFKYRFSRSVTRDQGKKVADIMLIAIEDEWVIEVLTEKGKKYLEGAKTEKNTFSTKEIEEAKYIIKDDQKIPIPIELIPDYLAKNYEHPGWEYFGEKCFSCGSCVLVCPTCYCFDVSDELELTLAEGKRIRAWDGCMLNDFSLVADGHNFRGKRAARFRHRILRKGKTLPEKYGYFGCVGCGRCADACTTDIAGPVKVFKYLEENK